MGHDRLRRTTGLGLFPVYSGELIRGRKAVRGRIYAPAFFEGRHRPCGSEPLR